MTGSRFYRLEGSRGTPGNGLGLSLVAAVARLHGARVELFDNAPGLRVELSIPGAKPPGSTERRLEPVTEAVRP